MSMSIFLIPLAVGLIETMSTDFKAQSEKTPSRRLDLAEDECLRLESRFNDSSLLMKTLSEYGLCPQQVGPDSYLVAFSDGEILYERPTAEAPFTMNVRNIKNKKRLMDDLHEIEQDYNGNVQEYTYQRVMNNLPDNMTLDSEEVLDDNSIVLTLNVN